MAQEINAEAVSFGLSGIIYSSSSSSININSLFLPHNLTIQIICNLQNHFQMDVVINAFNAIKVRNTTNTDLDEPSLLQHHDSLGNLFLKLLARLVVLRLLESVESLFKF